jgi:hypothetical protein
LGDGLLRRRELGPQRREVGLLLGDLLTQPPVLGSELVLIAGGNRMIRRRDLLRGGLDGAGRAGGEERKKNSRELVAAAVGWVRFHGCGSGIDRETT